MYPYVPPTYPSPPGYPLRVPGSWFPVTSPWSTIPASYPPAAVQHGLPHQPSLPVPMPYHVPPQQLTAPWSTIPSPYPPMAMQYDVPMPYFVPPQQPTSMPATCIQPNVYAPLPSMLPSVLQPGSQPLQVAKITATEFESLLQAEERVLVDIPRPKEDNSEIVAVSEVAEHEEENKEEVSALTCDVVYTEDDKMGNDEKILNTTLVKDGMLLGENNLDMGMEQVPCSVLVSSVELGVLCVEHSRLERSSTWNKLRSLNWRESNSFCAPMRSRYFLNKYIGISSFKSIAASVLPIEIISNALQVRHYLRKTNPHHLQRPHPGLNIRFGHQLMCGQGQQPQLKEEPPPLPSVIFLYNRA